MTLQEKIERLQNMKVELDRQLEEDLFLLDAKAKLIKAKLEGEMLRSIYYGEYLPKRSSSWFTK